MEGSGIVVNERLSIPVLESLKAGSNSSDSERNRDDVSGISMWMMLLSPCGCTLTEDTLPV